MLNNIGIFDDDVKRSHIDIDLLKKELIDEDKEIEEEFWDWGNHVLRDLNEPGCEHPFAVDHNDEINTEFKKIHRYSRLERFKFILHQLLGISGLVPKNIILLVKKNIGRFVSKSQLWNNVRTVLKYHGHRKYYNRIPQIILRISINLKPSGVHEIWRIYDSFERLNEVFNNTRHELNRKYFPNIRFVALKLMEKHGIKYPYKIPLLRTSRKRKQLEILFTSLQQ